jgi:type II restriction enzyme
MYILNQTEKNTIKSILNNAYMEKTIALIEDYFLNIKDKGEKKYLTGAFDEIYEILNQAKPFVDIYLAERKKKGEIKDESQALKSIAGNSFSQAIIYIFLRNKECGNIRSDIFITSRKSSVPLFDEISTIMVDGETQKPDCDLVIYSLTQDNAIKKCMILSLKTSLRERAGQTYKWKLLMEIATSKNAIKDKFNISYQSNIIPIVGFATVNFYNEINNPQQRGIFKFFDQSFIAKHVNANFISRLSTLPKYVNEHL